MGLVLCVLTALWAAGWGHPAQSEPCRLCPNVVKRHKDTPGLQPGSQEQNEFKPCTPTPARVTALSLRGSAVTGALRDFTPQQVCRAEHRGHRWVPGPVAGGQKSWPKETSITKGSDGKIPDFNPAGFTNLCVLLWKRD